MIVTDELRQAVFNALSDETVNTQTVLDAIAPFMTSPTTNTVTDDMATPYILKCWMDLCEKTDRTSPEEYPDHCLITYDELAAIVRKPIAAALSTHPHTGGRKSMIKIQWTIDLRAKGGSFVVPEGTTSTEIAKKVEEQMRLSVSTHWATYVDKEKG